MALDTVPSVSPNWRPGSRPGLERAGCGARQDRMATAWKPDGVSSGRGDDRLDGLRTRLEAAAPNDPPLEQISRGAVAMLDVTGAAVILMSEEESGALTAAFGARVAEIEDLQFALGEGPCLDAFRDGAPAFEPELGGGLADRWPELGRQAVALGAKALFSPCPFNWAPYV